MGGRNRRAGPSPSTSTEKKSKKRNRARYPEGRRRDSANRDGPHETPWRYLKPVVRFVISWIVALLIYSAGYFVSERGFDPLFDIFLGNGEGGSNRDNESSDDRRTSYRGGNGTVGEVPFTEERGRDDEVTTMDVMPTWIFHPLMPPEERERERKRLSLEREERIKTEEEARQFDPR